LKVAKVIISLVVIIGSLTWLTCNYTNQPKKGEPVPFLQPVGCTECGKTYAYEVGRLPAKCHYCGKKALWRASKCAKCNTVFPVPLDEATGKPIQFPPKCPKCGSEKLREVAGTDVQKP
jgi:predicted RNA-binding Zn-ribbon protein involved in translation (DUF1610 family)